MYRLQLFHEIVIKSLDKFVSRCISLNNWAIRIPILRCSSLWQLFYFFWYRDGANSYFVMKISETLKVNLDWSSFPLYILQIFTSFIFQAKASSQWNLLQEALQFYITAGEDCRIRLRMGRTTRTFMKSVVEVNHSGKWKMSFRWSELRSSSLHRPILKNPNLHHTIFSGEFTLN